MKRAALTFALALLACVPAQRLLAVGPCDNQDFRGTYGILARGAVTRPGYPITGPFARAGQILADGNGNLEFHTTASYNGFLFNEAIHATYIVSPDCTMVFHVQPFAPIYENATFRALLSDNKRQGAFMIVEPMGQTVSAVLKKQDAGACTERNLSGPYALHFTGYVVTPPSGLLSGEFKRAGRFVPDGSGNFSAETHANYGGFLIRQEDFSGTYAVARNCAVTIQYTYEGVPYSWNGSLVDNGKGADLMVSIPGFAVGGELIQQ
jgi:hypothetical protein